MKIEGFEVMKFVDHETGYVTLCLKNEKGGPVISGMNLKDAKRKFKEAIGVMLKFQLICRIEKTDLN